jgi:hypothetical protein
MEQRTSKEDRDPLAKPKFFNEIVDRKKEETHKERFEEQRHYLENGFDFGRIVDVVARMNFDEAVTNTTLELGDLRGQWYQIRNKPIWLFRFDEPAKTSTYIEIEIIWRGGIVGSVMDYDGMGIARKTKIMETFMKHLKPPPNGRRPQHTIDLSAEIGY